jgi:hypothetical protein
MTTRRNRRCWSGFVAIGVCLLYGCFAYPQKQPEEPISKDRLFNALKEKLTSTGLEHLIKRIHERRVSFPMTDADEQKIRELQRHLPKERLDNLITAVRESSSHRFFLDVTPRDLVDPYLQKKPLQADLAVAGYKGKWLRVNVEFRAIFPKIFPDQLVIDARDFDGVQLALYFDRDRYIAEFAGLRAGHHLSVTGMFDQVILGQVMLKNCEIENPSQQQPDLPVGKLTFSQEAAPSKREDAPYAVKVVIQTNVVLQPTSLAVKCSSEFTAAETHVLGTSVLQNMGEGHVGNKTVYWFFFGAPAFRPENPVVILLMAKQPIRVLGVGEGPPVPR